MSSQSFRRRMASASPTAVRAVGGPATPLHTHNSPSASSVMGSPAGPPMTVRFAPNTPLSALAPLSSPSRPPRTPIAIDERIVEVSPELFDRLAQQNRQQQMEIHRRQALQHVVNGHTPPQAVQVQSLRLQQQQQQQQQQQMLQQAAARGSPSRLLTQQQVRHPAANNTPTRPQPLQQLQQLRQNEQLRQAGANGSPSRPQHHNNQPLLQSQPQLQSRLQQQQPSQLQAQLVGRLMQQPPQGAATVTAAGQTRPQTAAANTIAAPATPIAMQPLGISNVVATVQPAGRSVAPGQQDVTTAAPEPQRTPSPRRRSSAHVRPSYAFGRASPPPNAFGRATPPPKKVRKCPGNKHGINADRPCFAHPSCFADHKPIRLRCMICFEQLPDDIVQAMISCD